ncbi:MAG: alpha-amylase/4-alpha-glucanotransferase domain-containing protein, partial [Candidatus Zixiibacteriota bacterium]
VYANLIDAEKELGKLERGSGFNTRQFDYDADGFDEVLVSTTALSAVFKPSHGGMLLDLSLLNHSFDITDTLSRRREGYHRKLLDKSHSTGENQAVSIHDKLKSKEKNLEKYFVYDWYLKRCFIDHLFDDDVTFDRFQEGSFKEDGDFILEPYAAAINNRSSEVILTREGNLWRASGSSKIIISKTFKFKKNSETIEIEYCISSPAGRRGKVIFAVENNFTFQAGHADDRFVLVNGKRHKNAFLDSIGDYSNARSYAMIDEYRRLAVGLNSDRAGTIWHLPIFTVSLSEGGLEKVYQGTTFLNLFEIELSETPINFNFTLFAGSLGKRPSEIRQ